VALGDFTTELDSADAGSASVTIPLSVPVTVSSGASTIALDCSVTPDGGGAVPTVTVHGTINAIQTASNN
jgi:hypothetical protein